ncbi:MAG TPA: alpha/beta hydrolase [Phototrophicaceae bacterium]|jgi:acetyl esterase/lipase|nr:alpha/beta hydrolase [Phototrophicaceae bacterium]
MARDLTPVHPELRQRAKNFPRLSFNRWNVRLFQWLTRLQPKPKIPNGIQVDQTYIQSGDQKHRLRLRIYKPETLLTVSPVLLWMHGGGLIIGSPEQNDRPMFQIVSELGIVVVSVDYRLAPNHPFPAPLDDCYSALKWVHDQGKTLGIDPNRIAIGGESAGAGLAASLVQLAHDQGEIHPIFQLLIYPMLDDRSALRTDVPHLELLTWSQQNNRFGWESYLGQVGGSDNLPPYAVPARREDLTGFPPAWIGIGTLDLFYDEAVTYAQKLQRYSVACELVVIPGTFHGFDQFDHDLPIVQAFRQSQIAALRKHLKM